MYRLQHRFGKEIDFINLNVDKAEAKPTRLNFGMRNRSHYILLDANQNKLREWFGPLDEQTMIAEIEQELIALGIEIE